ncbi:hypothetical protein CC86DRAFT_417582 [Ophiobolus disseminans]|uniref:Uncharacterized protein n=1 Tax=Ophiobolus disseminans TaxID=1469910 RepID=A0A6A7A148_9PLEO|nr:hypothetical protein CC86DRAFT_417582 [Ophiobolus disseminans]
MSISRPPGSRFACANLQTLRVDACAMFEQPSAKRVRRDELESLTSSPRSTPDPDLEELLRSRIRTEFTFTTADSIVTDPQDAKSDEDETELRLFATGPSGDAPTTHKIRLSSPGAGNGEPGFIVKKPRSYYFADEPTSEEASRLKAAAIDGKTILELANQPWPGCALPWKVRTITAAGMKKEVLIGHPKTLATVEDTMQRRKRKSKKTRIAIRKKMQATKSKDEEKARLAKEKEEAEREKRTRRNREKKVKKRAKAQAKKEGGDDGLQDDQVHPDRRQ